MNADSIARRLDLVAPAVVLAGGLLMAVSVVLAPAFWPQLAAVATLGAGAAALAARIAPQGLRFTAAAGAGALALALLAWAMPEQRDWAWGVAALSALFVARRFLPCASCVGNSCSTRRTSIPGFRFPPGH